MTAHGRWPANVILDPVTAAALDAQSGYQKDGVAVNSNKDPQAGRPHVVYDGGWLNGITEDKTYGGGGGASRFFYIADDNTPHHHAGRPMTTATIHHGECLDVLRAMENNSVDAIVTDPPYGLTNTDPAHVTETIIRWAQGDREYTPAGKGFMGQSWDAFVPPPAVWDECLRVLKPGGHLVAFAGSRTQDLMGLSIRLAGFDIRENLAWLYGSGFPKSLDVSKGIDKEANRRDLFEPIRAHIREWRDHNGMNNTDLNAAVGSKTNGCGMARHWTSTEGGQHAIPSKDQWLNLKHALGWPDCELDELYASVKDGAERPVVGSHKSGLIAGASGVGGGGEGGSITAPATPEAEKWQGWGTALKPAHEPIILARKPLAGKTVAANTLEWGTGGLNIDATRITTTDKLGGGANKAMTSDTRAEGWARPWMDDDEARDAAARRSTESTARAEALGRWPANVVLDPVTAEALDQQSGTSKSLGGSRGAGGQHGAYSPISAQPDVKPGYGDEGGASRFFKVAEPDIPFLYAAKAPKRERPTYTAEDGTVVQHPTVKPVAIMSWLVRLVCPPGGTVLDPFAGTGTTGEAAILEGMAPILVEGWAPYIPLIHQRMERVTQAPPTLL